MKRTTLFSLILFVSLCALAVAAPATTGMNTGNANVKSAGPLAFGPDGILFIGDSLGAQVVAIDTGDAKASAIPVLDQRPGRRSEDRRGAGHHPGPDFDQRCRNESGFEERLHFGEPSTGRRCGGCAAQARYHAGKLSEVKLDNVKFSSIALPNPPSQNNQKVNTITEVRYVDGKVLVAGLSNEEFSSNMKVIPFPFTSADRGALVEMYHGSHARFETNSPIRTFVPYTIQNKQYILAAYTCHSAGEDPGQRSEERREDPGHYFIAEMMGAGNQPLDMVAYNKNGHPYILMANSTHGVTKVDAAHLETYKAITAPSDVAGVPFESLADWKNVKHLQAYDDKSVLVLSGDSSGLDLKTVALP